LNLVSQTKLETSLTNNIMSAATLSYCPLPSLTESATAYGQLIRKNFNMAITEVYYTSVYQHESYKTSLELQFEYLKDKWLEDVMVESNPAVIMNNRFYSLIIDMGEEVIPFIIFDLMKSNHFWFVALEKLTGANPVSPEHFGNIKAMANDWINWYYNTFGNLE
jgi:hypothetical protein